MPTVPTVEDFLAKFEEALEMSGMIGAPANLLPSDLFGDDEVIGQQEQWTAEQEVVLIAALESRFGVDRMALMALAMNLRDKTVELSGSRDSDGNVIYIQLSGSDVVFAIGAPGFDFGD